MPLVIVTGTPCSGKTFRAQQIAQEFESRIAATTSSSDSKRTVIYIPSHHASLDPPTESTETYEPPRPDLSPRETIYDTARLEKTARAEEFSAIKRALSKNAVVIADAPNYIKGFRYQLYCEAKATGTRSVVVHTAAREDESATWNTSRLQAWNWPSDLDGQSATAPVTGPKIGKDILGDLQPESHTAIYGDAAATEGTRSRSSSTGAAVSDDGSGNATTQKDETMTLKSLYISDKQDQQQQRVISHNNQIDLAPVDETETVPPSYTPAYSLPSSEPPLPKASLPYTSRSLKSLHMRYEPPSPFTRWDTPLFTVPSADPHPPYASIWDALFPIPTKSTSKKAALRQKHEDEHNEKLIANQVGRNQPPSDQTIPDPVRQNAATVLPQATAPNALQVLESTTGELVKLILAEARTAGISDAGEGGTITIGIPLPTDPDGTVSFDLDIPESIALSQPSLQRLRRKFTQIQRGSIAHGQGYLSGRQGVAEGFVRFLEAEWEST